MRHVELEALSALLDGELSIAEADAAQAHVGECAECRGRLQGLRDTVGQLRELPPAAPPPHVREALRRQLAVEQEVRRRLWALPGWHSRLAAWPAMAAAVFLALGSGLFLYAYMTRQSAMVSTAEPATQTSDWRATITFERDDSASPDAPAAPPPAANQARVEDKEETERLALRDATSPRQRAAQPEPQPGAEAVGLGPAPPPPAARESEPAEVVSMAEAPLAAPAPQNAAPATVAESAPQADSEGLARVGESAAAQRRGVAMAKRAEEPLYALGPDVEPPVKISGENPNWQSAYGTRRPGTILVEAILGSDGVLRDLAFRPADLDPRMVAELRRSLASWRFQPARKDGRAVAVRYALTVHVDYR